MKVTEQNIKTDKRVMDEGGSTGIIKECNDIHNVLVEFEGGGSGYYCLIENCTEKQNFDGTEIEISQYTPLYYIK